ncbi:MAG TPA: hypothetical protein VLV90_03580 [Burkholderiales bacterium]|nr:hypothetical protein [Burkholderiales bacterium]
MADKVRKSNAKWENVDARLAEVQMSSYARLKAQAQLERAEAIADTLVVLSATVKRALKQMFVRPYQQPNASIR